MRLSGNIIGFWIIRDFNSLSTDGYDYFCDKYILQDGGSTNFYAGLTHHKYLTGKYSVGIIWVWDHCHHIKGNYHFCPEMCVELLF